MFKSLIRNICRWGILLPVLLIAVLTACVKDAVLTPVGITDTTSPGSTTTTTPPGSGTTANTSFDISGQTLLAQGTFVNRVHPVKGTVGVYEKDSKRTLVFTDFLTDSGPDLRIYLAEDAALTNFIEVSKLTTTGNFAIELPASYKPNQHKAVLIWCKAFSVLFGSAALTLK